MEEKKPPPVSQPGDGIRSMKSTMAFRAINFELYAKPVSRFSNYLDNRISIRNFTEYRHNDDWTDCVRRRRGLYCVDETQIRKSRFVEFIGLY